MAQKVLLADDSITIQKVVSLTFADEDFEVICVGNGEIAIDKIKENSPDIVLADIFMPRRTGYEVCEFIKTSREYRHIPVILLVGTFEPFDKNEAQRVGADSYLTKPFETTVLVNTVQQALAKAVQPAVPPMDATIPDLLALEGADPGKTIQMPLPGMPAMPGMDRGRAGRIEESKGASAAGYDDVLETPLLPPRIPTPGDLEQTMQADDEFTSLPTLESDELFLETPEIPEPAPAPPAMPGTAPPVPVESTMIFETPMELLASRPAAPLAGEPPSLQPADEDGQDEAFMMPEMAGSDDVLELPVFRQKLVMPAEEDILGVFDVIRLDAIIARQRSLEEAIEKEMQPQPESPVAVEANPEEEIAEPVFLSATARQRLDSFPEAGPAETRPSAAVSPAISSEDLASVLDENTITRIARLVVERLSEKAIREIVWEVVPELSELMIRREIEKMKDQGRFK